MKRAFDPSAYDAKLPEPKWPRTVDDLSEKEVAELQMINSLCLDAPFRKGSLVLANIKRSPYDGQVVHKHTFATGIYTSKHLLTWSKLVEALDLAYFDEDIVKLRSTDEAWKKLPSIMPHRQEIFVVQNFLLCLR